MATRYPDTPIFSDSGPVWHLLTTRPTKVPKTHRLREISHDEFRILARYLNIYRKLGRLVVVDVLNQTILRRLTGFDVERSEWRERDQYNHSEIPERLGENDYVLVAYGTVHGMYIQYSYASADRTRFREMVVTGVIEPVSIRKKPISEILLVAESVSKNYQRVLETRRLADQSPETSGTSKDELEQLVSDFLKQNDDVISSNCITPELTDDTKLAIEQELVQLEKENWHNKTLLKIEENLSFENSTERDVLQSRIAAIDQNIAVRKNMLTDILSLAEYLRERQQAFQGS